MHDYKTGDRVRVIDPGFKRFSGRIGNVTDFCEDYGCQNLLGFNDPTDLHVKFSDATDDACAFKFSEIEPV